MGPVTGPKRFEELGTLESEAGSHISEFFPGLGLHLEIAAPLLEHLIKGATVLLSDNHGYQQPFTSFKQKRKRWTAENKTIKKPLFWGFFVGENLRVQYF